jgi:hypothetical protein
MCRVDIIQCQHGNVGKFLSLCFFVLYYKTNTKQFFRIDIQLYQHSWKLGELEVMFNKRVARSVLSQYKTRRVAECFICDKTRTTSLLDSFKNVSVRSLHW